MTTGALPGRELLVADPCLLVADALREVLASAGYPVLPTATSVPSLLATLRAAGADRDAPALVLLAAQLAPGGLREVVRDVTATGADCLVLLSGTERDPLLDLLESGALGAAGPDVDVDQLLRTVEAACRGEACIPRGALSGVLRELIERRRRDDVAHQRYQALSRREREVLALLASGLSTEGIAGRLVLSPATVRTHLSNLMGKLGVTSQAQAVSLAHRHRLAPPERNT